MKRILDTCAWKYFKQEQIEGQEYYTVESVIREADAWVKAEKTNEKYDTQKFKCRPGFIFAESLNENDLEKRLEHYGWTMEQFLESFTQFDRSIDIRDYFNDTPSKVIPADISEDIEVLGQLLTKTLAYNVCKENPDLVSRYKKEPSVLNDLVEKAEGKFEKRCISILGQKISDSRKKDRILSKIKRICDGAIGQSNMRIFIERFSNGIHTDLDLVSAAYSLNEPVEILSDDLDVVELVKYASVLYGKQVTVKSYGDISKLVYLIPQYQQKTVELSQNL